jgi:hypothetical protein
VREREREKNGYMGKKLFSIGHQCAVAVEFSDT